MKLIILMKNRLWYSSQVGQDNLLISIFENKMNGFFVDLASNHWSLLSNTLALEKYLNWQGLCIEPNPMYYDGILSNRKCRLISNPVYSYSNINVEFRFREATGGILASNRETADMDNAKISDPRSKDVNLTTVTLSTILDFFKAPHIIEYLSLDVEGMLEIF